MNILYTFRMRSANTNKEISFAESQGIDQMVICILDEGTFAGITLNRERWEELVAALRDFRWTEAPKAGTEPSPKTEAGPLSLIRAAA